MCQDLLDKKYSKGYTLLEVMLSLLVFSIVTVSLSLPFCQSVSLSSNDTSINKANNLARNYLRDLEQKWSLQNDFDAGELIEVDSTYNNNDQYDVTVNSENTQLNDDGIVIIRRVKIAYKDSHAHNLVDTYLDYNRPGSSAN